MAHGYGRGCRCEDCREKHRETQLKYRQGVQRSRESEKVKTLERLLTENGVPDGKARQLAQFIRSEYV